MNVIRGLRRRAGLTQAGLARAAETSQPTIAAYEAGSKSPTLRTLARLAGAAGFEANVMLTPAMTREDRRSLALHEAIAERLRSDPERVLSSARANLRYLSERHPSAAPILREWRRALRSPVDEIADLLVDPRPNARELRHVTPFAGVLSAPERTKVYDRFRQSESVA